jgi:hypothetical protein
MAKYVRITLAKHRFLTQSKRYHHLSCLLYLLKGQND